MSYYFFNRQELLHKAKNIYYNGSGKETVAKYCIRCRDVKKCKK